MLSFPKKYTPKDLHIRSKKYNEKKETKKTNTIFSLNILPNFKKLSYRDFFLIYLKDFFNYKLYIQDKQKSEICPNKDYEQLFITYWDYLENISACYNFFIKKNQTLPQIWTEKLKRRIISSSKKNINANYKILNSYLSSNHKIYIPDSDLYIYILNIFHHLRECWKITNKISIWYRSFNLQTSIPSERILRKEEKIPCYTLKYFIWTKGEALYINIDWDIDLCCWDVAILVHPKDKRYNKYIWKNAIIPLCNRLIPIIGDETVNIAQNNWIKRVCPCAEEESLELAKKHWLPTDIFIFDKQWIYTDNIHEKAFIWKQRKQYYNNIIKFIDDIGNIAEYWEKLSKVPYLSQTNERLVPYKIEQLIINLKEEKQKIINKIFDHNIDYPFINNEITKFTENLENSDENLNKKYDYNIDNTNINLDDNLEDKEKEKTIEYLNQYLPDSIICNSQTQLWWKIPLIKDSEWYYTFFDLEKDCIWWKQKPLQFCFDFITLSLIRSWTIWIKRWITNNKIWELDKIHIKFSENENKINYLIQHLSTITWEKEEYNKFLNIIENLTDKDVSSLKDFQNLINNCKYLSIEWNYIYTNIEWITNDIINPDFIELSIPCYLKSKWININPLIIFDKENLPKIFKSLLIQELILWETITNNLMEYSYNKKNEFLWDKQLSKNQIEQSQWDIFSLYWENPIRLNFLIDQSFNQKQIVLNNIFLKQIWNAVRLCIQKDFLPQDIEKCLNNPPKDFEDFDICILEKLNEICNERNNIREYEEYINFFHVLKNSIQNIFFSRYLEIQKIKPTKNVQFVCSYFFTLLLSILSPLVPEFINALQYISKRNFIHNIYSIKLDKNSDYNMNTLYNTFIKIKQIKIEQNIKQHESCNIFIKTTPTIWKFFSENEQIFKNYFHISNINYLRLHEANLLWYEIFTNDEIILGIQSLDTKNNDKKDSIETIEKEIKNLDDKLNLLKERLPLLEWEQRTKTEEEYAKTKEEIENLTIKHSLLSSK